jgi:hypothetical protein
MKLTKEEAMVEELAKFIDVMFLYKAGAARLDRDTSFSNMLEFLNKFEAVHPEIKDKWSYGAFHYKVNEIKKELAEKYKIGV